MKKALSLVLIMILMFGGGVSSKTVIAKSDNLKPTWNNIMWLASAMYAENHSGEDETVLLTGIVICQRVRSGGYPDTIVGVISQSGQYSTWGDGTIRTYKPDERCLEIAEEILRYKLYKKYPKNLVFQSQFRQGRKVFRYIRKDHEYFCLA